MLNNFLFCRLNIEHFSSRLLESFPGVHPSPVEVPILSQSTSEHQLSLTGSTQESNKKKFELTVINSFLLHQVVADEKGREKVKSTKNILL